MSRSRRPSPAGAIALIALVVALAGTASALPGKNSVKSNGIKAGVASPLSAPAAQTD
jgi:hypothetical protein